MQFIFFDAADNRLFVRDDAETASWAVKDMQLTAEFPFVAEKEIRRGMRIAFVDEDGVLQPFEIRKVKTYEPDHYQDVMAEHIAVSELTDEFYLGEDVTDETADAALATLLTGTQWQVGTCTASNISSADIDKGTVWQNVRNIEMNWNVWITPRVTFSATGITGRYLDIAPAVGVWRGVTIDIDGNGDEMDVTVDDSDTLTAVYGLGGVVEGSEDNEALTFADVVWTATSDHPAKPSGQTYIEDPAAKSLYGRNGRNRFGYYQNGNIKDAAILLQKTWDYLKTMNAPRVTVECIVSDLKRMGYADQGIRLHDKVQVRIQPIGQILTLDVDDLDVNLLDPTATRPTIGKYIPNIVYINRQTSRQATGGSYRNGGEDNTSYELTEFNRQMATTINSIALEAYQRAYEDGVLSNDLLNAWSSINVSHDNITGLVAGVGCMLGADGRIVLDGDGFPVFQDTNAGNMYSRTVQNAAGVTTLVRGISAGQFSTNANYSKNDYVLYKAAGQTNSKLYRFTADHPAGAWTGNDVTEVTNLGSTVTQTSEGLTAEVTRATAAEGTLSGRITVNADKVGLVVEESSGGNVIKAASITAAINENGSQASINADRVNITGTTTIGDTMSYANSNLYVKGDVYAMTPGGSYHALAGNMVVPQNCGLFFATGSSSNVNVYAADMTNLMASLADVQIVPETGTNNLLLQGKYIGDTTWTTISTFSRAAKFSGAWNGAGTYIVTADPNGSTRLTVSPGLRLNGSGYASSFSAEMGSDQQFTSIENSSTGYLHQVGAYVGVYTNYSSGTYSGLIARIPVSGYVDTSAAEIVSVTSASAAYSAAKKIDVTFTQDIGVKATSPGGIDEVWASGRTASKVVDLTNLLDPVYQASLTSTAQQIRPASGKLGLLGVNIPAVNIAAKPNDITSNGTYYASSDSLTGYSSVKVACDYTFTCTENVATWTQSVSGYLSCGSISRAAISANTYLRMRIKCGNEYKYCYITVNQ